MYKRQETYFAGLRQKVEWQIQEYEDTAADTLTLCRLLDPVTMKKEDLVKDMLEFYMGKNTMERQNFIP